MKRMKQGGNYTIQINKLGWGSQTEVFPVTEEKDGLVLIS